MALKTQRDELLAAVIEMDRLGLVSGTSGNASVRINVASSPKISGRNTFLVTPAALPYSTMTPDQLVAVGDDLKTIEGDGVPSSESLLHLAIYRARPDVNAVMHTHSAYATALGVAGRPLPPIVDELVVYVGGQVEVADYGFPGTEALAQAGVDALGDRRAVLIPHHGISISKSSQSVTVTTETGSIGCYDPVEALCGGMTSAGTTHVSSVFH